MPITFSGPSASAAMAAVTAESIPYDHKLGAEMGKQHEAQGYGVRPLHLISGEDRAGNNFTIGH